MKKRYVCEEVAHIYKVQPETVWNWIRSGKLAAVKTGKQYILREEDLERFESERLTVSQGEGGAGQ